MLTKDEEHAMVWWVRSISNDSMKPQNCDFCLKPESRGETFPTDEAREQSITETMESLGCLDGKPARIPYKFDDGYILTQCPHKVMREGSLHEIIRAYTWLDNHGILPFGEFNDQSERFIKACEVLRYAFRKAEQEQQERANKRSRAESPGISRTRGRGRRR